MSVYDPIRQTVHSSFKPEEFGDPAATSAALFEVVDSEQTPLRLMFGAYIIAKFGAVYASRLATWQKWEEASNAARGCPAA